MKNQKLIQRIDTFYHLASSMPIRKMAEAAEFDRAVNLIRAKSPTVLCKNGHAIKSELPSGPTNVHQFMVVSTNAHKPEGWGIVPDDALVFIFLDEDEYFYPQQYPDDPSKISIATAFAKLGGVNVDDKKYFATLIGKSQVMDKKDASNKRYSHCVAVFKKE